MIGETGLVAIEVSPAMLHPGPISIVGDEAFVDRGNQWPRILVPSNEIRSKLPCLPVTFVDLTAAARDERTPVASRVRPWWGHRRAPAVAAERDAYRRTAPAAEQCQQAREREEVPGLSTWSAVVGVLWSALVRASIIDGLLEMLRWTVQMVVASRIPTWPRQRPPTIPSPRVPEKSRIVAISCVVASAVQEASMLHAGARVAWSASRSLRNRASASARSRVRRIGGSALTRSHR